MKNFILYLWQLPQNILALLVILVCRCKKEFTYENVSYWSTSWNFGVSLGNYIIGDKRYYGNYWGTKESQLFKQHEYGHTRQSLKLGWLYLFLIGIPSASGNIYDRLAHTKWSYTESCKWYYNQLWEKNADKLGGIYFDENNNRQLKKIFIP